MSSLAHQLQSAVDEHAQSMPDALVVRLSELALALHERERGRAADASSLSSGDSDSLDSADSYDREARAERAEMDRQLRCWHRRLQPPNPSEVASVLRVLVSPLTEGAPCTPALRSARRRLEVVERMHASRLGLEPLDEEAVGVWLNSRLSMADLVRVQAPSSGARLCALLPGSASVEWLGGEGLKPSMCQRAMRETMGRFREATPDRCDGLPPPLSVVGRGTGTVTLLTPELVRYAERAERRARRVVRTVRRAARAAGAA